MDPHDTGLKVDESKLDMGDSPCGGASAPSMCETEPGPELHGSQPDLRLDSHSHVVDTEVALPPEEPHESTQDGTELNNPVGCGEPSDTRESAPDPPNSDVPDKGEGDGSKRRRVHVDQGVPRTRLYKSPDHILAPLSPPGCTLSLNNKDHRWVSTWSKSITSDFWIDELARRTFSRVFDKQNWKKNLVMSTSMLGINGLWRLKMILVFSFQKDRWNQCMVKFQRLHLRSLPQRLQHFHTARYTNTVRAQLNMYCESRQYMLASHERTVFFLG